MDLSNISNILVDVKNNEFDMPGFPGMTISLNYLGRDKLTAIRDSCTTRKRKKNTNNKYEMVDDLDSDKFQKEYIESVLVGWTGLTLHYLEKLVPMEVPVNTDMSQEVPFSKASAVGLMLNGSVVDNVVTEFLADLESFNEKRIAS